jgi:hypothetical protein
MKIDYKREIIGYSGDDTVFGWKLYIDDKYVFSSLEDDPRDDFEPFISDAHKKEKKWTNCMTTQL